MYHEFAFPTHPPVRADEPKISCSWKVMRAHLLEQWKRLRASDLDRIGPNRRLIAQLIERKYGIAFNMAENYLLNFERTMPMPSVSMHFGNASA